MSDDRILQIRDWLFPRMAAKDWSRDIVDGFFVMAMRFRSFSHCDGYLIPDDDPAFHLVYSVPNRFGWVYVKNEGGAAPLHYRSGKAGRQMRVAIPESDCPYALIYRPVNSTHELAQAFYRGPQWCLPYYAIVIPLTTLSAFLLLTKPRKSTPNKINEPAANEGA